MKKMLGSGKIVAYIIAVFFTVIIVLPLAYMLANSLKDESLIYEVSPQLIPNEAKSLSIVMDYSDVTDSNELLDRALKDSTLVEYMVLHQLDQEHIYEIQFYGMKNEKIIFYTRAHRSKIRLELDFGIYAGARMSEKEPILNKGRYIDSSKSIGYLYNESGIEKKQFHKGSSEYKELAAKVDLIIRDICQTEGQYIESSIQKNNFLWIENYKYYLQLPGYMYGKYSKFIEDMGFSIFVFNSIIVLSWAIVIETFLCSITAYGISGLVKKRTANIIMLYFLATMMVPFVSTLVPQFIIFKSLGFYNNYLALMIPFLYPYPYYILLYKGFFDQLPSELFDAARIDGANEFYVYSHVVMGISKPIISVIALSLFISNWNDFFWAWLVTEKPAKWTLNVALYNISQNLTTKDNFMMGLSLVTILPVIAITIIFAEQIKNSLATSGIKG